MRISDKDIMNIYSNEEKKSDNETNAQTYNTYCQRQSL